MKSEDFQEAIDDGTFVLTDVEDEGEKVNGGYYFTLTFELNEEVPQNDEIYINDVGQIGSLRAQLPELPLDAEYTGGVTVTRNGEFKMVVCEG